MNGDATTLKAWSAIFTDRAQALVIEEETLDGPRRHHLHSASFDGLPDTEIRPAAIELLNNMNGAAMVSDGLRAVTLGDLVEVLADGTRAQLRKVTVDFQFGTEWLAAVSTGSKGPPVEHDARRWLRLAMSDSNVSEALTYFIRSESWFDIYKAFEVIRADLGDEKAMAQVANTSVAKVKQLRQAANFYRHARGVPKLAQPMHHPEAQALLRQVMRAWMAGKLKS